MTDRKVEIELKRAKVEAIRLERQRREAEKSKRVESVQNFEQLLGEKVNSLDADSILRQLGIEGLDSHSQSNGIHDWSSQNSGAIEYAQDAITFDCSAAQGAPPSHGVVPTADELYRRLQLLSVVKVCNVNVAPVELISYTKETQTNIEQAAQPQRRLTTQDDSSVNGSPRAGSYFGSPRVGAAGMASNHLDWDDEFVSGVLIYDGRPAEDDDVLEVCLPRQPRATSATRAGRADSTPCRCARPRLDSASSFSMQSVTMPGLEFTEDDRSRIASSDAFVNFVMRASRIVERTLEQDDTLIDYSTCLSNAASLHDDSDAQHVLTSERDFYDEKWCRNRLVTALEWHHHFPELLLTSYSSSHDMAVQEYHTSSSSNSSVATSSFSESGVCLVWNARFKPNVPEFVFTCESALTTACFVRQQPNLLIGGTYSGQLVLWDTRVPRRTPVHRTPLSATAHTHPIFCVQAVSGSATSQVISVSSDGRLCVWSAEMLTRPLERLELAFDKSAKSHVASGNVAVTALSCPSHDANAFLVGSEDGGVYLGSRHGQTQNRTGLVSCFEAHGAHVSAVHCSPHPDLSHLFLTAAFDSTVRLWSLREDRPLCTLERSADYLNDVQFSPTHPALLASVDSLGRVELWNLLRDLETPACVHVPASDDPVRAQCKVRWNSTGNRLAVGDCAGHVQLLALADRLAQPHGDEIASFGRLLQDLKAQTACAGNPHPLPHRFATPLSMAING